MTFLPHHPEGTEGLQFSCDELSRVEVGASNRACRSFWVRSHSSSNEVMGQRLESPSRVSQGMGLLPRIYRRRHQGTMASCVHDLGQAPSSEETSRYPINT